MNQIPFVCLRWIVLVTALSGITSCELTETSSDSRPVKQPPLPIPPEAPAENGQNGGQGHEREPPFSNSLMDHKVFDPSCQSSTKDTELVGTPTDVWHDGLIEALMPEGMRSSAIGLQNAMIMGTYFGLRSQESISLKIDSKNRIESLTNLQDFSIHRSSSPLKLCETQGVYPALSGEAAALSAAYLVTQAHEAFRSSAASWPLEPIRIEVFPRMVELYQVEGQNHRNFRRYITDNAAFGIFGGKPTMFIMPRSIQDFEQGMFTEFNLWQSPMVMAHEYGHHVFFSALQNQGIGLHSHHSFLPFATKGTPVMWYLNERAKPDELMMVAISEGFADLFSFYTNKDEPTLTDKHTCLEVSRNIKNPTFSFGVQKRLTQPILKAFYQQIYQDTPPCQSPDFFEAAQYADPHVIGAIIAFGIDQILEEGVAEAEVNPEAKLDLLLMWLKQFSQKLKVQKDKDLVLVMLEALFEVLPAESVDCNVARQTFSSLVPASCQT